MKTIIATGASMLALAFATAALADTAAKELSFSISFPTAKSAVPLDGRVILMLSPREGVEPRTLVEPDEPLKSPYLFSVQVDGLKPGAPAVIDAKVFGWPAASLSAIKAGDYTVQAVLNRYLTYHRADGSTVSLSPDRGEGQNWSIKPGNLYSTPIRLHVDPAHPQLIKLTLDSEIAPIKPPADSEFVRQDRKSVV